VSIWIPSALILLAAQQGTELVVSMGQSYGARLFAVTAGLIRLNVYIFHDLSGAAGRK
jgi:hypothetical protein